jgi:hypothetical protein
MRGSVIASTGKSDACCPNNKASKQLIPTAKNRRLTLSEMMKQASPPNLVNVVDVCGKPARINRDDYDNGCTQLRLYTKRNKPSEYLNGLPEWVSIHRDNVAVIGSVTVKPSFWTSVSEIP